MAGSAYPLYEVAEPRSFAELLEQAGDRYASHDAFRGLCSAHTYEELVRDARHAADALKAYRGGFCWLDVADAYRFAVGLFACVSVGCVAVLCEQGDLRWLELGDDVVHLNDEQVGTAMSAAATDAPPLTSYATDPDALALVATSSGTTGHVKGVMLSQTNLLSNMVGGMQNYRFEEGSTYLHVIPFTHLFGIVADLMAPLNSGGTICYSGERLRFFEDLRHFAPTNLNAPPALVSAMHRLLDTTGNFELATGGNLRKIICASAHMDDSMNELFARFGLRSYQGYGLTECSPCVALSRDDFYKAGSVGQVLSCLDARIEDGELCVRGPSVMLGYLGDPKATAEVLRDGWLHTGDLGSVDADGFVFLTGRKSDLVVFEDGTKASLARLEGRLDALASVVESRVDAVTRDGRTRLSITVVVDDGTANADAQTGVQSVLDELGLRAKLLDICLTKDPLPRNRMGKLLRHRAQ